VRACARVIARRDGGGEDWEECRPFLQASRWPNEVASARGGLCRTIVGVRRGIEESQPARIARRKVDKTGVSTPNSVVVLTDNIVVPSSNAK
jgi:hypothetical protein